MIIPRIFFHEIKDKFFEFDRLSHKINRILELGTQYKARFTFFVTAAHINRKNDFILQKIVAAGHEVGSHAYRHVNFQDISYQKAKDQIQASLDILTQYAPVNGFRAPYLKAGPPVASACKDCGLIYHSSNPGGKTEKDKGLWHIPVTQPMDYEVIQNEMITDTKRIGKRWVGFAGPGQVLLFHPWRLGARKYIGFLEKILQKDLRFGSMTDYLSDPSICCITFDLDFLQTRQVYIHTLKHLIYSPHILNRS